ncbi:MAG: hypothetical protein EAZ95_16895 [Bacteroidetes bacterium]|nr:MAG: hypothetical protein EAZ95_16895 [Bacteroidota bacterium]
MAKTEHYFTKFETGKFYHIYNRTVDCSLLFKNAGNYRYFINRYKTYMQEYVDTYCYALLGNHFHLLLRVKDKVEQTLNASQTVHDVVSHQFQKFFQSYAVSFNKQQKRVGTLFQTPFKRALVDDDDYFSRLVYYIHNNPVHHGFTSDFEEYEYSSYHILKEDTETFLDRNFILNWFGGIDEYIKFHTEKQNTRFYNGLGLDEI